MNRSTTSARFAIALLMTPLLLWLGARAALAAPPTNDTFAGATAVTSDFSETLKTTEATTDTDDTQLGTLCGFAPTDASVWYAFTAATDGSVQIDVSTSDYSAGILVGTGTQGALRPVTCGHNFVEFPATEGIPYYISVFDSQLDGGGNGGVAAVRIKVLPPIPLTMLVGALDSLAEYKDGKLTVSGVYVCTEATWITISGTAHQKVGRFTISGFINFFKSGTCDGTPHPWSAEVTPDTPDNGKFVGGELEVSLSFIACREFIDEECAHYEIPKQIVPLRRVGTKDATAAVLGNQLFLPSVITRE